MIVWILLEVEKSPRNESSSCWRHTLSKTNDMQRDNLAFSNELLRRMLLTSSLNSFLINMQNRWVYSIRTSLSHRNTTSLPLYVFNNPHKLNILNIQVSFLNYYDYNNILNFRELNIIIAPTSYIWYECIWLHFQSKKEDNKIIKSWNSYVFNKSWIVWLFYRLCVVDVF